MNGRMKNPDVFEESRFFNETKEESRFRFNERKKNRSSEVLLLLVGFGVVVSFLASRLAVLAVCLAAAAAQLAVLRWVREPLEAEKHEKWV